METINYLRLSACITLYFHCLRARESYGYIGCFKDDIFRKTIWSPKVDSNNGAQCIHTCISSGYIYAATQSHYCKCGMSIRGNPKQVSCGYRCPGYQYEICGGRDSMSVFDIRLITKTEKSVTQSTPSTTQIIALITSTETESTKQADYNREMATQTQSRTEIRRAEMRITTDKAPANNRETSDVHVYVFISIPFVIVVMFAVTVAIIYYRRRKRRMQENEQSDRPNSTEANSNYYLTAVHADNYTYTSVQDTLLHPSVANADSKDVNDLLHSMPLASTVQNEYVDISYEELVSQRKDEHYYSQPNKNLHRSAYTTQLKV
ncbi:uncharacterized protein LOC123541254 isoform X2 [Mercenaria mercenaria]|uniref:uncharacterized protein LOC123541254 isoform X2 n=1 Tax=Mercenaria mercenaria TaxID=6596 RepID=UPI00234EEB12|nr:uncharacterized protein LOC123541254 isoform X2 [Mercenaria mercenaria]